MCGRFTLTRAAEQVPTLFENLDLKEELLTSRYNVAPTQKVLAIRHKPSGSGVELGSLRWGLIPSWSNRMNATLLVNARCETLAEKPSFREAFRKRRCLIPADGFFEWKQEGTRKRPYWIHRPDKEVFTFAGLWETWKDDHGETIESCTVVTTAANQLLKPLHERMPVIVPSEWRDRWLDVKNSNESFAELYRPAPEDWLVLRAVSFAVNAAGVDSPECIEPTSRPTEKQLALWEE